MENQVDVKVVQRDTTPGIVTTPNIMGIAQ